MILLEKYERNYNNFQSISSKALGDRKQLIDWILVKCNKLSFTDDCFFLTIDIMDRVLIEYFFKLNIDELH